MGPSLLMQWTLPSPPGNLSDIIMLRLLEHYSLSQPMRSQIHFRTYRTTTNIPGQTTRLLTTIQYTTPSPLPRDAATASIKDDTTYLFLEDRTIPLSNFISPSDPNDSSTLNGQSKGTANGKNETIEIDGFEIMDIPPDTPATIIGTAGVNEVQSSKRERKVEDLPKSTKTPMARGSKGIYRTLAVRPSSNVLPLLQNLLSPFVMGLTKSARAAASTTAQTATPTPLPGVPFTITSYLLPPLSPPNPYIQLTMHALNSSTPSSTIFLEAEWPGQKDLELGMKVLKEFLEGCLPDGAGGDVRWHEWVEEGEAEKEKESSGGWEGAERTRRMTMLLAKCLREASYI